MLSSSALILFLFVLQCVVAERKGFKFERYKTEPNLHIPTIIWHNFTKHPKLLQPWYIFTDPITVIEVQGKKGKWDTHVHSLGPLIYDTFGTPVYGGEWIHDNYRTQNTHPCAWDGDEFGGICYTKSSYPNTNFIINSSYEHVFERANTTLGKKLNRHEFQSLLCGNKASFIHAIYHRTHVDLQPAGGPEESGIKDGCFEDIDMNTGELILRFCSHDYIGVADAVHGHRPGMKDWGVDHWWDYEHINSVDKNDDGDYLVSARYFHQVFKVAGVNAKRLHNQEPGTVVWRAGGKASDFNFKGYDLPFALQHDARFVSTNASESLITVHDNRGHKTKSGTWKKQCYGKLIRLNHNTMEGEIVSQWPYPEQKGCHAMGSMRRQPNGNAFIGFGGTSHIAEYSSDGTLLFYGTYSKQEHERFNFYRSVKGPWVGRPKTSPRLLAYSNACNSKPLVAYVSWNGATEVSSWRFQYRTKTSPWISAGTYVKDGFETKVVLHQGTSRVPQLVMVEALAANGTVLGSATNSTFIPTNRAVRKHDCGLHECSKPDNFPYGERSNGASGCDGIPLLSIVGLGFIILCLEFFAGCRNRALDTLVGTRDLPFSYQTVPANESDQPEVTSPVLEEKASISQPTGT